MNLFYDSNEFQLKIKFILIISLLQKVSHSINVDKILPISCQISSFGRTRCPTPGTHCNKDLKLCECDYKYPIALPRSGFCLDFRSLGEECLIEEQCRQTENSFCVNSKQIDSIAKNHVKEYFKWRDSPKKRFGHCKCKQDFKQVGHDCYRVSSNYMNCSGAHECMQTDLNSHCDKTTNRCYCDPGYVYDTDKNECRLIAKKFGDICVTDSECHNWDRNLECRHSQCFCKTGYDFDLNTQRCKQYTDSRSTSKSHFCAQGLAFDDEHGECRRVYEGLGTGYRFFSIDKLLEMIVIVVFCFVTIAFLRFWRYILPQNVIMESNRGMFSDFTHPNRVQRRRSSSRSNSLSRRGRVIQLRVNIDSPEPSNDNSSNDMFVSLPVATSYSSLPPYESTNNPLSQNNSQPPPYNDEKPPSYEEAMALFSNQK